jgi:hypothetical protein
MRTEKLRATLKIAGTKKVREVGILFNDKRGEVTIGGSYLLKTILYSIYTYHFSECDGDPDFYPSPIPGKVRLSFRSNYKNYLTAIERLKNEGYNVNELTNLSRVM